MRFINPQTMRHRVIKKTRRVKQESRDVELVRELNSPREKHVGEYAIGSKIPNDLFKFLSIIMPRNTAPAFSGVGAVFTLSIPTGSPTSEEGNVTVWTAIGWPAAVSRSTEYWNIRAL
ncbi:hypothetical protein HanPSC8_Chr11g0497101 [Helianthus annuus]|nr:hypothetical protein HanPSC8_Chr11g0497101 [Helianthus annuus]